MCLQVCNGMCIPGCEGELGLLNLIAQSVGRAIVKVSVFSSLFKTTHFPLVAPSIYLPPWKLFRRLEMKSGFSLHVRKIIIFYKQILEQLKSDEDFFRTDRNRYNDRSGMKQAIKKRRQHTIKSVPPFFFFKEIHLLYIILMIRLDCFLASARFYYKYFRFFLAF